MRVFTCGRGQGKTDFAGQIRDAFIRKHPEAVILTYRNGEAIVEKPVHESPQKLLPPAQPKENGE